MNIMLATVVSRNTNVASIMFLIAVVLAAIATFGGLSHRPEPWWPFLWAPIMLFISLGLLFAF